MRIGIGYDIHAFSSDRERPLRLGGVTFPGARGLEGHSDADVVLHAICDALLGAFALGDIGEHFAPGDEAWRNANSVDLLIRVRELLPELSTVSCIDVSIIAEAPRIGPRKLEMRQVIAATLGIDPSRVSIKATTNEQLGALGRGEGIAAFAVALLEEVR